jgi:DNA-3-methyladenine glycosylase II
MKKSLSHLQKHPPFARLIKKHGPPRLNKGSTPFQALARAIIHQQISGKAAESIYKKFVGLFGILTETPINWDSASPHNFPTPEQVMRMPIERMRVAGLSAQKTEYLKDLAKKFSDGTIAHESLHTLSNNDIIASLTKVKGVGVWTVQMFLIFTLHRPDVLPVADLGIRKGFQIAYKLRALPSPSHMERIAKPWREHASIASWYLWRVADEVKITPKSLSKKSRPRAK